MVSRAHVSPQLKNSTTGDIIAQAGNAEQWLARLYTEAPMPVRRTAA